MLLVQTLALACTPPPHAPPVAATPGPTPGPTPAPAPVPVVATPETPPDAPPDDHCQCPPAPGPDTDTDTDADTDDESEADPQTTKTRRARARKQLQPALATRLRRDLPDHRHACDVILSGPCTLRGDFDGDKLPDHAILVRDPHNAGGIAVLWGKGSADLLGAGRHQCWTTTEVANLDGSPTAEPCLEPIDTDLGWIAHWALLTHERTADTVLLRRTPGARNHGHPAPGALGDGLLIDGGDAAAALHRTTSGWTLMHLGY
jgi:hypothetical protein